MPKVSVRGEVAPSRGTSAALAALLAWACGGHASSPGDIEGESLRGGSSSSSPSVSVGEGGSTGTGTQSDTGPSIPDAPNNLVGSPAEPFGPPVPPPELARVEDDSPGPEPVNGTCPTGTEPVEPASCTSIEKRSGPPRPPCVCRYVCSPACVSGEVCAPDAALGASTCRCHAALEPSDAGCTWTALLQNASFDDDAGWKLWTSGLASASSATIGGGELRLEVAARCAYVWAGTTARLPSRDQFPNGAALVLEYASNSRAADAGTPRLFLDGVLHVSLPKTSGLVTERHCVQLEDAPRLASLYFDVETYGTCAEPLDYQLIVYDVRLEANAGCL